MRSSAAPKESISWPTRRLLRDSVPIALDAIGIVVLEPATVSASSTKAPKAAPAAAGSTLTPRIPGFLDLAFVVAMAFSSRPNMERTAQFVKFVKSVNSDGGAERTG